MSEKIRQQIRFNGRVQGVGFRFTARHVASMLSLTGWTLNEYDGSVLMEVQGELEIINKMIDIVSQGTFIEIDNIERKNIPLVEHETTFEIKD